MTPTARAAVCAVGLAGAAVLGIATRARVPAFDAWLHGVALAHRGGGVATLAQAATQGGSTLVVWPMVAVAALAFPRRGEERRLVTTLAFGGGAALAIGVRLTASDVFHRARPPLSDWIGTAGGYAFPSGHTTAATIGAGTLAWAASRWIPDSRGRTAVWVVAVLYAGVVGWSRVWLGVHWPLDVLGGWLLGAGWLAGMSAVASAVERSGAPALRRARSLSRDG